MIKSSRHGGNVDLPATPRHETRRTEVDWSGGGVARDALSREASAAQNSLSYNDRLSSLRKTALIPGTNLTREELDDLYG